MGAQSRVYGYIEQCQDYSPETNIPAIRSFHYDEKHPFTNIFFFPEAKYFFPIIGFAGSYRQLEEAWNEWLWKFSQLLSTLDARYARVHLDCYRSPGRYTWLLMPESAYLWRLDHRYPLPYSLTGEEWGIVEAPEDDFTLNPWPDDNRTTKWNPETGQMETRVWELRVPRWD
jgi:hypothetical protein